VLRADEHDFVLEPLGRRVNPVGLSAAEVCAVDELLELAERPFPSTLNAWSGHPRRLPRTSAINHTSSSSA
jgi:hypothetical protein